MTDRKSQRIGGWICLLIGSGLISVAMGWLPEGEGIAAPPWVLGLCGATFAFAGLALLSDPKSPLTPLLAGLICLAFAAVGFWSALGPSETISGGLPFLPRSLNVKIARVVFAGGALLCLLISGLAFRDWLRRLRKGP